MGRNATTGQQQRVQEQVRPGRLARIDRSNMTWAVSPHLSDEEECDGVGEIGGPERREGHAAGGCNQTVV